jgi:V8-like Glu-specific endopeptidase
MPTPTPNPADGLEIERLSLERDRLKLERQKLSIEVRFKRRELVERQGKSFKELLANPLSLAIVGGFITLMTTVITTSYTANENRRSEDRRAAIAQKSAEQALQAELVKKFVEAPKTETVRENLRFLVNAGLLSNYAEGITKYLKDNPDAAPTVGTTFVGGIVGTADQRIDIDSSTQADRRRFQGAGTIDVVGSTGARFKCTGFLAAPGILVTARHCFGDTIDLKATATFEPLSSSQATSGSPRVFHIDLTRLITVKGSEKEFSEVAVAPLRDVDATQLAYLPLEERGPDVGQPLEMAFLPLDRKSWVYSAGANCRVLKIEANELHHLCDTGFGSGGAAVLSETGKVVGIHLGTDVNFKRAFRADIVRNNQEVRTAFGMLPTAGRGRALAPNTRR